MKARAGCVRAVVAAVVVLGLSGCAGGAAVSVVTRAQAKARVVALVDQTVKVLPVGGWVTVQEPYEEDCASDDGGKVDYSYLMSGGVGADPDADARRVAALWRGHGMTVRILYAGGARRVPQVDGEGGQSVQRMQFLAKPSGYAVTGVSLCVP